MDRKELNVLQRYYIGTHSSKLPSHLDYRIPSGYVKDVTFDSGGLTFHIIDDGDHRYVRKIVYSIESLPLYPGILPGNVIFRALFL